MSTRPDAEIDAQGRARALDSALKRTGEGYARLYKPEYSASCYVVEVTGNGVAFAYDPSAVDIGVVSATDWDRQAWHASVRRVDDLRLAVTYFMLTGNRLARSDGTSVLSDDQIKVLDFVKGIDDRGAARE
jgi:hypothetical protein